MSESFISLFEFKQQSAIDYFSAIDDWIMGGVSNSSIVASESGTLTFSGIVSLENNSGFALIRASLNSSDT